MFIDIIFKIESYLDDMYQFANNEHQESNQFEQMLEIEEVIKSELEIYPSIVSELFDNIISAKKQIVEFDNATYIFEVESLTSELFYLMEAYQNSLTIFPNDDCSYAEYNWNPSSIDENELECQRHLDQYSDKCLDNFDTLSKLRLEADIARANEIYQFIKSEDGIVTKEKILREFADTSIRALKMALNQNDILSYDSVYIAADNLHIRNLAKRRMYYSLESLVYDQLQHNVSELFEYATVNNSDFLSQAKISNPHQLFSVVAYIYSDRFTFKRPYIAASGVRILSADDQLKKYVAISGNHSIRNLLDYAKTKKITVDNIVRILTTFNDRYYIYNKEHIIPIVDTGINESCKQQLVRSLSKELMSRRCVAIRDLETFPTLPAIGVQWTEWLVYSVLKQMNVATITVALSSDRFKDAIPIVAMIGEDTAENIHKASCKHFDTDSITIGVDNLDDLDLLLEDIIDFNVLGDNL